MGEDGGELPNLMTERDDEVLMTHGQQIVTVF
jgi:hypothetical protein